MNLGTSEIKSEEFPFPLDVFGKIGVLGPELCAQKTRIVKASKRTLRDGQLEADNWPAKLNITADQG